MNILLEGQRLLNAVQVTRNKVGVRNTEFTLVDYPTMDDRYESNLKSNDRSKQEIKSMKILYS